MSKDPRSSLSLTQIGVVVGVALAAYFLVDLGRMVWDNVLLRGMVAKQERKKVELEAELERIESLPVELERESYLEEWAREERHLVQEGDVPIIVDPPMFERSGGEILSRLVGAKPPPSRPHWREWWDLFLSP